MNSTDWAETEAGQKAAVEWALKMGSANLDECARQLGISAAKLRSWLRNAELKPEAEFHDAPRPESDGVEDDAQLFEKALLNTPSPNIPRGAVPSAPPDLLAKLLDTSDILHDDERSELADILKSGATLSQTQRTAIAAVLMGSATNTRLDIIKGIMDLVLPVGHERRVIWEVKKTTLSLEDGQKVAHLTLSAGIAGFPMLGRSVLVIERQGKPESAIMFCRARTLTSEAQVPVRYLAPSRVFDRNHVMMQMAIIASFVREDGRGGKDWAALFGCSESLASHHQNKVMDKISALTGGKSRPILPGMKSKPQSNKGGPQTSRGNRKHKPDDAA